MGVEALSETLFSYIPDLATTLKPDDKLEKEEKIIRQTEAQ